MPQALDTQIIDTPEIACNGDKDIPHPRVFLTINTTGTVDCPYCGKHFVLKEGAHANAAH